MSEFRSHSSRARSPKSLLELEISREQTHVTAAYNRLDRQRAEVSAALVATSGSRDDATELFERDVRIAHLEDRLSAFENAEHALCFGRLDKKDGERIYIGRVNLRDHMDEPLVIDWRAPAARPFYAATVQEPLGLVRRRHLTLRGRRVEALNDDLLDIEANIDGFSLQGDGALLNAIKASRTGRMGDVIATLQAEQDEIIRAPARGVLVVQGAPGTGKTVVALHRAAYLLYTTPNMAKRGVLVVGPNPTFLAYVSDVLPSLGESNVVFATMATLYPGLRATATEPPDVAGAKSDARMAVALSRHLHSSQGGPAGRTADIEVNIDGERYVLPRAAIERALLLARETGERHNLARRTFRRAALNELATVVSHDKAALLDSMEEGYESELAAADRCLQEDPDGIPALIDTPTSDKDETSLEYEHALLTKELAADAGVASALESLWPALTAVELLAAFLDEGMLNGDLDDVLNHQVRQLVHRERQTALTEADIALIDEAVSLLGVDDSEAKAGEEARRQRDIVFARAALAQGDSKVAAMVSAEALAERHQERDLRTLAERAAADPEWTYGHIIADEAQDLTPMQWRMLNRRCPLTSMTIVGDMAQSSRQHPSAWEERLREVPSVHRTVELTVCYRAPRELVDAAEPLLRKIRPDAPRVTAIRTSDIAPRLLKTRDDGHRDIAAWVRDCAVTDPDARMAVITPTPDSVADSLGRAGLAPATGLDPDLRSSLVVLPPALAKGLEFDHVLVHDPSIILEESGGLHALYVAFTRSTQTLMVVQQGDTPALLAHLSRARTPLGTGRPDEQAVAVRR